MWKSYKHSPRCTPYFHWAGIREYGDYCRGKALKCMNDVFTRIGEFQEVDGYEEVRSREHSNMTSALDGGGLWSPKADERTLIVLPMV